MRRRAVRVIPGVILVLFGYGMARASDPKYGVGINDVFLHQQQHFSDVFNDQGSRTITQSAMAKRGDVEYFLGAESRILFSFLVPVRDEILRVNGEETERYHFPKSISVGYDRTLFRTILTDSGWLEWSGAGGIDLPLSQNIGRNIFPFVQACARVSIGNGAGLSVGGRYSGVLERGNLALHFGINYRM